MDRYHPRIVVLAEKSEKSLGDELKRQVGNRVINMVGQTTLRQAYTLLKRCHLYVGNDNGPKHMAAAAGVPVIEINGHPPAGSPLHPNSPSRFGPWGVWHRVILPDQALASCSEECTAAKGHCIFSITVEQVEEAIVTWLSQERIHFALPAVE